MSQSDSKSWMISFQLYVISLLVNNRDLLKFRYYLSSAVYVCVCVCLYVFAITVTVQPRSFKLWQTIPYVNI